MARKQLAEQRAEHRRQRDEQEWQRRAMVITEFDAGDPEATTHAMATEILKYRSAVRLLAKAIGWADAGAPFALIAPVLTGVRGARLKCPPPAA
jgi:sRNA-binding protein